jgi:hypothetical protein
MCEGGVCESTFCELNAVSEAHVRCIDGYCGLGLDCNVDNAVCESEPPECPEGMLPTIVEGCWGACLVSTSCADVRCEDCPEGTACVTYEDGDHRCAAVLPDCLGEITCDCLELPCSYFNYHCFETPDGPFCQAPRPPPG